MYWQQENLVTGSTRSEATQGYLYADEESAELDPLGNDVGRTDPYAQDGLADYGGSYEIRGNAFDESGGGCVFDGVPVPCSVYAFAINSGYIHDPNQERGFNAGGQGTPQINPTGSGSALFHRRNNRTNQLDYRFRFDNAAEFADAVDAWQSPLWVRGGPSLNMNLMTEAVGSGRFAHAQQNSGFRIGKHGFSDQELNQLKNAYNKIMSSNCLDWLNKKLSKFAGRENMLRGREATDVGFLLQFAELNKYSPELSARDMGITQRNRQEIADRYENRWLSGANAVTLGSSFVRIYLMPTAFYNNGIAGLGDRDLSGIIVHELFHVAGHNEARVQQWNDDIQKYCGNSSDTL